MGELTMDGLQEYLAVRRLRIISIRSHGEGPVLVTLGRSTTTPGDCERMFTGTGVDLLSGIEAALKQVGS